MVVSPIACLPWCHTQTHLAIQQCMHAIEVASAHQGAAPAGARLGTHDVRGYEDIPDTES
jgi:hypothetical protein